jgi:putative addiction module component (TIGR02574 family)
MTVAAEELVLAALKLPAPARAYVAEKLFESIDTAPGEELSPAWRKEVRRRCAEIDSGTAELRDAEEVFARAFAALE